jgi:7-carboxy-7-deazaguanine synthase (Cx14CxxC type)
MKDIKLKKYSVKEIFYSIQGEGFHSGRPAVFIRFSGCNLWSGKEKDRDGAICKFCDTDFVGTDGLNGGVYSIFQLLEIVNKITLENKCRFIVLTGGEPLLQVDTGLVSILKEAGYYIAVETNGTIRVPNGLDWLTVSPKAGADLIQKTGDELKLVYPQDDILPKEYEDLNFKYFYLQPKDDNFIKDNINMALEYCLNNPCWRLSLQLHKILGVD